MSLFQISENPGAIREIISKLQIYDENLRDLLYAMSCEDVGKRISARDALAKIKGS